MFKCSKCQAEIIKTHRMQTIHAQYVEHLRQIHKLTKIDAKIQANHDHAGSLVYELGG